MNILHFKQGKLKFSAGHFTIFSATERETLHGHNYTIELTVAAEQSAPGIVFDYRFLEDKLFQLTRQLHLRCLIPQYSPYLMIEEEEKHYRITFNHESMWLLKNDVVVLPIQNISLESLSQWFVDQLKTDRDFLNRHLIKKIVLSVFNGPYNGGEAVLMSE